MRLEVLACLVLVLAVCSVAAGCGGGGSVAATTATSAPHKAAKRAAPGVLPRTPAEREMAQVVHAWSTRLNAGDYDGIARLFALPAILIQGQYEYRLTTRHQVALWHSGLPCSGKVVSITYAGKFATAVFRLGNRAKSKCDAPGSLAAARFEIVGGKIVAWVQVAVPAKAGNAPVA
jgi:hypothetical protein